MSAYLWLLAAASLAAALYLCITFEGVAGRVGKFEAYRTIILLGLATDAFALCGALIR